MSSEEIVGAMVAMVFEGIRDFVVQVRPQLRGE